MFPSKNKKINNKPSRCPYELTTKNQSYFKIKEKNYDGFVYSSVLILNIRNLNDNDEKT